MILLLSVAIFAAPAAPDCDPTDAEKCAVAIEIGVKAPFTGQLLTPKLAIDLGMKAKNADQRIALEVRYAKRELQLDLNLEQALCQNRDAAHALEIESITRDRDAWQQAAVVPFYRQPWVVATASALAVSVLFVGAAQAVK